MKKTTVYLPDDLKERLEAAASAASKSEADIIRDAVSVAVEHVAPPEPQIPLVKRGLGDPKASERVDRLLKGFGR